MKRNLLLIGGITFSVLAVTMPVMAQPQPGESGAGLPPQATPGGPGGGQFNQFRGGNGGADSAQRQEHRQKMLQRFDANHDGKLDDGERAQMHQFMQQHRMMREQQNGDQGSPSGNVQKGLGGPGNGGGLGGGRANGANNQQVQQKNRQKMVQRFDANHDGRLDDGERTQLREFIQQRRMMREKQNGGSSSAPPAPSQQ